MAQEFLLFGVAFLTGGVFTYTIYRVLEQHSEDLAIEAPEIAVYAAMLLSALPIAVAVGMAVFQ